MCGRTVAEQLIRSVPARIPQLPFPVRYARMHVLYGTAPQPTRLQYVRRNAWTLLNGLYYAPNVTSPVECPILQGAKVSVTAEARRPAARPGCSMCGG
jgi:hypothetical protein